MSRDHKDFHSGFDLLISLGGDGTFLKSVSYIRDSGVPIMGINTGRLGFLSNISKDHIYDKLAQVRMKQFEFQRRSLLRVSTPGDLFGEENFALNELTLQKKDTSSMVTVHAYLDKKFLNSYSLIERATIGSSTTRKKKASCYFRMESTQSTINSNPSVNAMFFSAFSMSTKVIWP